MGENQIFKIDNLRKYKIIFFFFSNKSIREDDAGIEMQVLGSSEIPSRLSVDNHSEDLSCANSAMSIDYPEQASSTIGMFN